MEKYVWSREAGIIKKSIKRILEHQNSERDISEILHGDLKSLYKNLPKSSQRQLWESSGKRIVHLEEIRFVLKYMLRNDVTLGSRRAIVLGGMEPAISCTPWAMTGLIDQFDLYENQPYIYLNVINRLKSETCKIQYRSSDKISVSLTFGDCLNARYNCYGLFDLDFCSNHLRDEEQRNRVFKLLIENSPENGIIVVRTTIHVGRVNNSKKEIREHIRLFNEQLSKEYEILALDRSPYVGSVPMASLIWILDRKSNRVTESPKREIVNVYFSEKSEKEK
jgi:hypothetical protein